MKDIYIQLRSRVNEYSVGMSQTKSGIELKILERLFSEDEAKVYLGMTRSLESPKKIASRCGLEESYTAELLESMTDKGITFPSTKNGRRYYAAAPFMHGFFEQQMISKKKDPELSLMIEEYLTRGFKPQTITLRTVPIGMTVQPKNNVLPFDDIKKIIEKKERIAVTPCFCRYHIVEAGKALDCSRPHEMCFSFDYYADCAVEEYKIGRFVTRDEALKILTDAEKAGLVHQTAGNAESTEALCNCCPDCCAGLRILKLHPKPGLVYAANYRCSYNPELCIDCMACIDRCPMYAFKEGDGKVDFDPDRCIGCGLCVSTCPSGALELVTRTDAKEPPKESTFIRSSKDMMSELDETIKKNE